MQGTLNVLKTAVKIGTIEKVSACVNECLFEKYVYAVGSFLVVRLYVNDTSMPADSFIAYFSPEQPLVLHIGRV